MKKILEGYFNNISSLIGCIQATDKDGKNLDLYSALESTVRLIGVQTDEGGKLMFIGNGASASISSHMATDYWKNGGMRAICFNDSAQLTCLSNDYGYDKVFEIPIQMFADEEDVLFAISSSGASQNILNGVKAARAKGIYIITFSGFEVDNPLRFLGDFNFYVPQDSYGPVEILHLFLCHSICDAASSTD